MYHVASELDHETVAVLDSNLLCALALGLSFAAVWVLAFTVAIRLVGATTGV